MENYNNVDCFVGKTLTCHCMSNNVSKLEAPLEYVFPGERFHSSCAQYKSSDFNCRGLTPAGNEAPQSCSLTPHNRMGERIRAEVRKLKG